MEADLVIVENLALLPIGKKKEDKVVAVSGGFALGLCQIGHIRYLEEARKLGGKLIVILNSDEWVRKKYGFVPLEYRDRERILKSCRFVDAVVPQLDKDQTVARSLRTYKPDIFVKAGDRTLSSLPEAEILACQENLIDLVYIKVSPREASQHTSKLMDLIAFYWGRKNLEITP